MKEIAFISLCSIYKKGDKIKIYDSMADASRTTNTRVQDIYNCCKGRQKTANGFIWKYYD